MPIAKKCDICGSQPERLFLLPGSKDGCAASVCLKDGLVFLSPGPSAAEIHAYYSHSYDDDYRNEIKQSNYTPPYENFELSFARFKDHLSSHSNLNILDVGSGMGWATDVFGRHLPNSNFCSIEASEYCRDVLKQKNISIVSNDLFSDWDTESNTKYDLIHARHVFEHLDEPNIALKKFHHVLSDGGIIYLCVPDMLNPMSPLKTFWFRTVHSHYYTLNTLTCLLQKSQLTVFDSGVDELRHEFWILARKGNSIAQEELKNEADEIKAIIKKTLLNEFVSQVKKKIKNTLKSVVYRSK